MDENLIKTIGDRLQAPSLLGDVGFNLPAKKSTLIRPGEFAEIPTGITVELPPRTWGIVLPRSSTNRNSGLLVLPGVIDEGFRGEITILVYNLQRVSWLYGIVRRLSRKIDKSVRVEQEQSIAQLVILPAIIPEIQRVECLSPSARGKNAFGSTTINFR